MDGCAAKSSFCSALIVKKIHLESNPHLLDKIRNLEVTECLKDEVKVSSEDEPIAKDSMLRRRGAIRHNSLNQQAFQKRKLRKQQQQSEQRNVALVGSGEASDSLNEMSLFVFKRDFAQLATFTGSEKIGVIYAPPTMISKNPINLYPDQLDAAQKIAKESEPDDELRKKLYRAFREHQGFETEFDLLEAIKEALKDCDG